MRQIDPNFDCVGKKRKFKVIKTGFIWIVVLTRESHGGW